MNLITNERPRGAQPSRSGKSRKTRFCATPGGPAIWNKNRRELARALAPLVVEESWYLDLEFDWTDRLPVGSGVTTFRRYIEMLPGLLDNCPRYLTLLAGLEAYHPARRNPPEVSRIVRGEKAWPKLLKPWRLLREMLYYHGVVDDDGLLPVPRPGWLRQPSHWSVAGSGPLLTESESKTRRARK